MGSAKGMTLRLREEWNLLPLASQALTNSAGSCGSHTLTDYILHVVGWLSSGERSYRKRPRHSGILRPELKSS
jgi:hypothetical protein